MNNTNISWTELTWNPASGCSVVSTECKFCYAESLAENKRGTAAFPKGFELTLRPHKLAEPARIKSPSLIFCNSMSDFGLEELPDDYRDKILDAIESSPRHRYQILTKRPEVVRDYLKKRGRKLPSSVWMGVTIGHSSTVWRRDVLLEIEASVHWISAEPLLSALPALDLRGIDWLVTGGESGLHARDRDELASRFLVRRGGAGEPLWVAREERLDWVRDLRDRARAAGCAFWHKQHGGPRPPSGGRTLDGRTHDELPRHITGAMPEGYDHAARAKQHAAPSGQVRLPVVP